MRIVPALTLPGALALAILLSASAPAAAGPIDYDIFAETAPAGLGWDNDYSDLTFSTVDETFFVGGFYSQHARLYVRATDTLYHIGANGTDLNAGEQHILLPPATLTKTPGFQTYHYPAGALWTITNLLVDHGDGTSHIGNFSAILGEINVNTYEQGGDGAMWFHHGQWDPETAALLGLPGHEIYGISQWYLDFNEPDFGQDERLGRVFGVAAFKVPEPGLLGLLTVGGLAAVRRRRR